MKYIPLLFILFSFSFNTKESVSTKYKLVFFEGSDWCVNCIRFDRNVLSDPYFKYFLEKQDIEIERIDFPQRKKQDEATKTYNASIAEKFNFQGVFPTIILVENTTGEIIPLNYHDQGIDDFIAQIKSNLIR
ncbi:thioredoxin fold domain-containing protein [Flagellimonas hymeniacidonis]|uniref:Thioredoxin fold domain-containing protein n=1 Tax=Flagellimonas hymeniacidonis TaxID=2603628 RepID=A0A5C8V145_9FLAO|nr:thioredoxin fold domain-containing protein [Flagellimonas hymeniacidonis]TXN35503.1 thioredoxin fold domain-containing protein [Flagellimonas hymeniacidonis]